MTTRVLFVIDHTGPGGAQVAVFNLIKALRDQFEFSVAVLGYSGEYSASYRALGAPVYELGRGHGRWSPVSFIALIRCIQTGRFDLIHSLLFKSHILATLAARWTRRKSVIHDQTGIWPESLKLYFPNRIMRGLYFYAYRQALKTCERILVLTPDMAGICSQVYRIEPRKLTLLPNSIDIDAFSEIGTDSDESIQVELGLSPSTRLIVTVGRLEPEKDVGTFLKVAQQVQAKASLPMAFLILGTGSEEPALREYVLDNHLGRVFFLGHRHDIPRLLHQANVMLLTSRLESFGLVILEAMAAGCPVVATRSRGPESILTDGVTGLLADIGDVPKLAGQVMRLLLDQALSDRLIGNARQLVVKYSHQRVADDLVRVYKEILR